MHVKFQSDHSLEHVIHDLFSCLACMSLRFQGSDPFPLTDGNPNAIGDFSTVVSIATQPFVQNNSNFLDKQKTLNNQLIASS